MPPRHQADMSRIDMATLRFVQSQFQIDRFLFQIGHGNEDKRWWHSALKSEVALAGGDPAAAETAYSQGLPDVRLIWRNGELLRGMMVNNLPSRDLPARVRKAEGNLKAAIEIYQRLNTADRNSQWTAVLEPRYVLELARLLDQSGDAAGARAQYQRFLELWNDADPGLPELDEARRYLENNSPANR